jgi:hypothetical protein
MKIFIPSTTRNAAVLLCASLLFAGDFCRAQFLSPSTQPAAGDYAVTQVGPHSRVWGSAAGPSVTEIATGMNYWDGQQWTPSDPSFVISQDGTAFVAAHMQDPTRLAANLNCDGAVTVTTPDNVILRSTPAAIALYDAASGLSVIVATLTNTAGILADPQHVVYPRAFVGGGFTADVVYSLPDSGSFHQDVVFTGFDKTFDPTVWGFAASATNTLQIQICTEFYNPPQPQMLMRPLYVEKNQKTRASMASPDFIDYTLDFGHYVFGPGRAYLQTTNTGPDQGVMVAKSFVTEAGRTFLVESIPFKLFAGGLRALPSSIAKNSAPTRSPKAKKLRVAAASLPLLRPVKPGAGEKIKPVKSAALARPRGAVVDYVVTVSSMNEPTFYSSDTTYFVAGTVYNSSSMTIESAVFKYPTNSIGSLVVQNTLTLATTNYRPAIFTAADDNTAGTTLNTTIWSGYTGNPSSNYYGYGGGALTLNTDQNITMNNLRFCYIGSPIAINVSSYGQVVSLSHSELVNCVEGITISGANGSASGGSGIISSLTLNVNNCLMANVQNPFWANDITLTGTIDNCTIDTCTNLLDMYSPVTGDFDFYNCILSQVPALGPTACLTVYGDVNAAYNGPTVGGDQTTLGSYPFQAAGAGKYYLPVGSPLLDAGWPGYIDSGTLSQLEAKTTQAPLILTNAFSTNTVLTPQAQRDTTGTALGFHYDPIDYLAACSVSNATLLLTNGVAVAYFDNLGIWLQDGSQLVSQGTPNSRNYLVYYGLVQEQPFNLSGATNALAQALPIAPSPFGSSAYPSIFLRLTTICAPQGETNLLNTGDFVGYPGQTISGLTLRDCEVYGAGANWRMSESNNTPSIGLTNNVFHRTPFAISNAPAVMNFNNLFYAESSASVANTTISIRNRSGSSPNTNANNVFDGVNVLLDAGTAGYNAYLNGATNANASTNATDIHTTLAWLPGALGGYYQATNGPLFTNGSTYAADLGLYHYTVATNNVVEGTNLVSRGYHYVAVGTNGLPLDTSGDGVPDYLADPNGNNSGGSGSWTHYVSPNGLSPTSGLMIFTPLE